MKRYIILILLFVSTSYGITVEEAIKRAKEHLPFYYQNLSDFRSYFYIYRSSISQFFPTLSYSFSYLKYTDRYPFDYFSRTHSLSLNWRLYDSGYRYFNYRSAFFRYRAAKYSLNEVILDIVFQVKYAYLKSAAAKEMLNFRKIQFKAAKADFELATDKQNLGLVKKSDVLQAKVRFENAKYSLVQAENEYKKSVAELNSLIGLPLNSETEVDTSILDKYTENRFPDFEELKEIAFKERPQIKSLTETIKAYEESSKIHLFQYTPSINVFYSINNSYSGYFGKDRYNTYGITLDWVIFSGLKRYYDYLSSKEKERYNRYALKELKRNIELNLFKKNEDLKTAYTKLELARTILEQAQINYEQVLGEYRAGTSDIIALLTAESSLASAHETFVQSILELALTKISIERELGVEDINNIRGSR
ncbi:TolC family protein [Persephonella sp.]